MSKNHKRLPVKPSAEHLRKQAKRRQRLQGITTLSQAQKELAQEYGAKNWPELMHVVETMLRGADQLANVTYEWEALPKAVSEEDMERVIQILEKGAFTQHDLDLALARSLMFPKRKPYAELLIAHGADVDGQYGSDYGPIVLVCGEGLDHEALAFMIEHGCDVTFEPVASKYGPASPMLHTLGSYVRNRNEAKHCCIDVLLDQGADLQQPADIIDGMGGQTPIFHAAMAYHYWKAPGLLHLIKKYRKQIDTSVKATVQRSGDTHTSITVMELFKDDAEVLEQLKVL